MSPGQGEEVEGQGTGQPGPETPGGPGVEKVGEEEGGQGASPEVPPGKGDPQVVPPPNTPPPSTEVVESAREPKGDLSPEMTELPPHLNLWVHSCGILTAGSPPAKCPGCQRLSPEGEWFLYKVALV